MSFDLKKAIATIAPTLANMLGGPMAGTAVAAIAQAVGLPADSSQDDVTRAVQNGMTPETIAAMRKADQEHEERLRQADIDLAKINADHDAALAATAAADRDSARKRQIALRDSTPEHLAYLIILGFFAVCSALIAGFIFAPLDMAKIDGQGWTLIGLIIGFLGNEAKAAAGYYYGTNRSSSDKNDILDRALQSTSAAKAGTAS